MIELILLGMLYEGNPATSYDLKKVMENSTEFFHNSSLGSIQPALKKLEKEGYLTSEEKVENNRLKKYYHITDTGKEKFNKEIRKDFGPDKLRCNQLVKLFFFDTLSLDEQLASIDAYMQVVKGIEERLKAVEIKAATELEKRGISIETHPGVQYRLDTLQFGLDYHRFVSNWFSEYKETLKERSEQT